MKNIFTPVALTIALSTTIFTASCGGGETKKEEPKKDTVAKDTTAMEPELPTNYRGYEITEMDFPATVYMMHRETISMDEMEKFMDKHMEPLTKGTGKNMIGAPVSLYWMWDDSTKTTDMAVAVPVMADAEMKMKGYERYEVAAGKALVIEHKGSYDKIGEAHLAMDDYMKDRKMENSLVIEEYVTNPNEVKDTSAWITKIYYVMK